MSGKRRFSLAVLSAAALLVLGCQPLVNVGGKGDTSGQHYIKLTISAPMQGRAISVAEYQVTELNIEVRDPNGEVVQTITWHPAEGAATHMVPVEKTGEYELTVTHLGEQNGESVEATETAAFTIGEMMITVIEVVPGKVGMINVSGGVPPVTQRVLGKLLDGYSGAPLAGGIVEFAGHSATSGADGGFELDLGQGTGTVTGTFSIHAAGFVSFLFDSLTVDVSSDSTAIWSLQKIDLTGLPGHTLNFRIFELQSDSPSPTEVPDGTPIVVYIVNENGGVAHWNGTYGGGYSFYGGLAGQSCVVSVYVDLAAVSAMHSFNVITSNVALTAASVDLSLYEDPSNEQTVSITGNTPGNNATLHLSLPNAFLYATEAPLDGSAPATVYLSNPDGYEGFWAETNVPLAWTDTTTWASTAIGPIGSSVVLPIPPSPGAVTPPDPNTLEYTSGTLSVDPVMGVDEYGFLMMDAQYRLIAGVTSAEASVTLPTWMQSQLAGGSLSVIVYAAISTGPIVDMSTVALTAKAGIGPSGSTLRAMGGMKSLAF